MEDMTAWSLEQDKRRSDEKIRSLMRQIEEADCTISRATRDRLSASTVREAEQKRMRLNQELRRAEEERRTCERRIVEHAHAKQKLDQQKREEREKIERLHREYELQRERIAKERREREEREAKRRKTAHQEENAPGCGCNTIVLILAAILIIFGIVTGVNNLRNKDSEKGTSPSAAVTMVQEEL